MSLNKNIKINKIRKKLDVLDNKLLNIIKLTWGFVSKFISIFTFLPVHVEKFDPFLRAGVKIFSKELPRRYFVCS